jgi:fatty acid desaturase
MSMQFDERVPQTGVSNQRQRRREMLETIAVVLIVLWLLGLVTSYTMGGLVHALLVIAVVVILIRVIQGRSV